MRRRAQMRRRHLETQRLPEETVDRIGLESLRAQRFGCEGRSSTLLQRHKLVATSLLRQSQVSNGMRDTISLNFGSLLADSSCPLQLRRSRLLELDFFANCYVAQRRRAFSGINHPKHHSSSYNPRAWRPRKPTSSRSCSSTFDRWRRRDKMRSPRLSLRNGSTRFAGQTCCAA